MSACKRAIAATSAALTFLAMGQANASLIGAGIDITAANGLNLGTAICKTASVSGVTVDAGLELTGADWGGGCAGSYSADISADQLVLQAVQYGNYEYATLNIHIASGPAITGVVFGGYTDFFFYPFGRANDSNLLPAISFDADDITITWKSGDDFHFNGPTSGGIAPFGTASFRIMTASANVPEPVSLALLGIGLAGFAIARRRRI